MSKRKFKWRYVKFCEHCGEYEFPVWGADDGGTSWCSDCVESDGETEAVPAPVAIEKQIAKARAELAKAEEMIAAVSK